MEISILFFFWTLPLMLIETWGNTIRSKTNFGQMLMIKYNMSLNLVTIQVSLPRSKHLDHTNEYFITDQTRTTPIHLLLTCYNCHTWNISPPPVQHILSRWYKNPGQLYCVWTWPGLTLLHITVIVIVWAYIYSVSSRASNEHSRRFHNHGEGPY